MGKFILGVLAGFMMFSADAMDFELTTFGKSDTPLITAYGEIVAGDDKKFSKFISDNPELAEGTWITLHSNGGNVAESHIIAYDIRYTGKFNTMVFKGNSCESACTDILLGGVERAGYEGSRIGYHSASIENYDDFTGHETLMLGQRFAVGDLLFATLYADKNVPGWKVVKFYNEIFDREDNSIMIYPSMERLLEAGMITRIVTEKGDKV